MSQQPPLNPKPPANDVTLAPPGETVAHPLSPSLDANPPPVDPELGPIHAGKKIGKYLIRRMIGRGGMGAVYEAMDVPLQRKVALKILPREFSANDEALQRFIREARLAARLNHPNAVGVYDVGKKGTIYFIAMELVIGASGADMIEAGKKMPWREATRAVIDACRGLTAAHAVGIVHRDIKPGNLLFTQDGHVKVSDFGLAKPATATKDLELTRRDQFVGTPLYMSPEQCRNDAVDERTDIYSLGATYFTLLTGQAPFSQGSALQILFAHCSAPVPDVTQSGVNVPPLSAHVIRKAMAKAPDERYQSAAEMQADLEAMMGTATDAPITEYAEPDLAALGAGEVIVREPSGLGAIDYATPLRTKSNLLWIALGAGVAVFLILGLASLFFVRSAVVNVASTPVIATNGSTMQPAPSGARSVPETSNAIPSQQQAASGVLPAPIPVSPSVAILQENVTPTVPTPAIVAPSPTLDVPAKAQATQPVAPETAAPALTANAGAVPIDSPDEPRIPPNEPLFREYARVKLYGAEAQKSQSKVRLKVAAQTLILWSDFFTRAPEPRLAHFAEQAKALAEEYQPGISETNPRETPPPGGPPLPPTGQRQDDKSTDRPPPRDGPNGGGTGPGGARPQRPPRDREGGPPARR